MVKRMSVVKRREDVSREDFVRLWIGEHAEVASALPGLRHYSVDFVQPGEPNPGFDGIATVRFDSLQALQEAFRDPELAAELARTRDAFATSAIPFIVDEHEIVRKAR